jgi:capsular polysaccharide export protein
MDAGGRSLIPVAPDPRGGDARRPAHRAFLFLQGPHGPFFDRLARRLRQTGASVRRVGFTGGDRAFWPDRSSYIPFTAPPDAWPGFVARLMDRLGITDLVLYGDTRSVHAEAIRAARARGVTVHVFEEGYMRPYWITYERNGANGHSRLMQLTVSQMRTALARSDSEAPLPPAHWGDMRQHVFYGALYHGAVALGAAAYRNYQPHRGTRVGTEFLQHLLRVVLMPIHAVERTIATARIRRDGFPYHLALLQLDHDASFRAHSPFASMSDFLTEVIDGFATGAPAHHHLVVKAHPLDDGGLAHRRRALRLARAYGIEGRVHFVRGGKLARLLDHARSAVTINSTAGQQALWRGLPLKTFGRAIYARPELVSGQSLAAFFADPANRTWPPIASSGDSCWKRARSPAGFTQPTGDGHFCAMWSITCWTAATHTRRF